ncbi:hypothetical protein EC968_005039 [Mortierella alpina]|nr:hypothetical protein EC968_005039 [Mortierella alpina]
MSHPNDPRASQHYRPFQPNPGFGPPQNARLGGPTPIGGPPPIRGPAHIRGPAPVSGPGSNHVPPFIDPRQPNVNSSHHPQFGHPVSPLRFPGHHPQQQQPRFGGVHNGQAPTPANAAAFYSMTHSNHPYGIRTSSSPGSSTTPALTSPTQPPNRQLPPIPVCLDNLSSHKSSDSSSDSSGSSSSDSSANISPRDTVDGANSLYAGFEEIRKKAEKLQRTTDAEPEYIKTYNKGVDLAVAATAHVTMGSTLMNQGMTMANKVLDNAKVNDTLSSLEKNPVLHHLVQLADKLVDIGKTVPFIAPAFVILKLIIDVEQRARDTDVKCTDLLERINFMVSNITVLEKVKAIEPLVAVISKMNDTLKRAASLIQAYRKQGAIARRLNISNSQNFVQMAEDISACSQDLMLSLQIQQTGDISVLTRMVPMESQDEEAKTFVMAHGGQSVINSIPPERYLQEYSLHWIHPMCRSLLAKTARQPPNPPSHHGIPTDHWLD